jgi:hypothetical protein
MWFAIRTSLQICVIASRIIVTIVANTNALLELDDRRSAISCSILATAL